MIEVFPAGTLKRLGISERSREKIALKLVSYLSIQLKPQKVSRDEADAIISVITAYLYVMGLCDEVRGEGCAIVLPSREKLPFRLWW